MKTLSTIIQVIHAAIKAYKKWRSKKRLDAVRADPSREWVQRFGGTDNSTASDTDDAQQPLDK